MTLGTVGFGRSFPKVWLIPIGMFIVVFGLAVFGVLSRSVVADFLAWWPVWVGLGVAAFLLRDRKFGVVRASGVVPLAALVFVGLFVWGHVAGWSVMPSASQRLVGPETGTTEEASLEARLDGVIDVSGGSSFLYLVEPASGAGQFGIPTANEEIFDSSVAVKLVPDPEPGLYTYAGWDLMLSVGPLWTLNLDGALNADLTSLRVSGMVVDGAGTLTLGMPVTSADIDVAGQYQIVVPRSAAVTVSGVASVPDTWTLTDFGAESPAGGEGRWSINVVPGATVRVTEG